MPHYVYLNNRFVPYREAMVPIEDRGYQFADGVYEVMPVINGQICEFTGHMDRLYRSLAEISLPISWGRPLFKQIMKQLLRLERLQEGNIYLQITRGVAPRNFPFPKDALPSLVIVPKKANLLSNPLAEKGMKALSQPDIRWGRCDIKTIALLAQVLAKQKAAEAGCLEAFLLDDKGYITEGAASNAWMVKNGVIYTRPAVDNILAGVTRNSLLILAEAAGVQVVQRPFSLQEALAADELFISSASYFAMPVVMLDEQPIADGKAGALTNKLRALYIEHLLQQRADIPWKIQ
ncbi:MAG: D-amino-acid transaminase [Alphaproteobacteria bacterium]